MKKIVMFFVFAFALAVSFAQTKEFKTKFVPYEVTYNGSDNPNECWESVDQGILIRVGDHQEFFLLPAHEFELLRTKLTDEELVIQVVYFDEPDQDSGADGSVVKITLNGTVIFTNQ